MPQIQAAIAAEIRNYIVDAAAHNEVSLTIGPLTPGESTFTVTTAPGDNPGDGEVFDVIVKRREP